MLFREHLNHWFEPDLSVGMSVQIATDNELFYYNCYPLIDSVDKRDGASAYENSSLKLNTYITGAYIPKMGQK